MSLPPSAGARRDAARPPASLVVALGLGFLGFLLVLALLLIAAPAGADELDDILGGFEEEEEEEDVFGGFDDDPDFGDADSGGEGEGLEAGPTIRDYLSGDISVSTSYNYIAHYSSSGTYYGNVQKLRTKLRLQFDADLFADWKVRLSSYAFYDFAYLIHHRSNYTPQVLDIYEWDYQVTDNYFEGSLHDRIDLKIGRQVVNWGRSESLRVLDVINPLDVREPGIQDIEDLRLSTTMIRVGGFYGPWSLTALAIPEIRFDIVPPFGSDFFPSLPGVPPELLQALASIPTRSPEGFGKAWEGGVNITGIFSGWDISLQAVTYFNDVAHLEGDLLQLERARFEHARLWQVGAGGNYTWGSWLFKAELAYIDGLEFFAASDSKSRIDFMAGVEYYGWNNINIVFEIANRHINDFERSMERGFDWAKENSLEMSLRFTWDLLNQNLHLTLLATAFGEQAQFGSFVRLSASYDVMDALNVDGGIIFYQEGDDPFWQEIGDNDRLFLAVKYSF